MTDQKMLFNALRKLVQACEQAERNNPLLLPVYEACNDLKAHIREHYQDEWTNEGRMMQNMGQKVVDINPTPLYRHCD